MRAPVVMAGVPQRVEGFLFPCRSAGELRLVMAGLSVLIGVQLALFPWHELAGLPSPLFEPVAFLGFLDGMPPLGVIVALQAVGVAAAVLATMGWRRPLTFALAWAPYLILAGLRGSRGKIQHNDLLLVVAAIPFLLAPSIPPRGASTEQRSALYGWPIRAALTFVAGAYFYAGLRKLVASGVAWVTTDNMRWILYAGARKDTTPWPALSVFIADRPWLAHVAAAAVLGFELGFPFLLASRRLRPALPFVALAFHGATWLTLDLDYWKYAAVVALLVTDWDPWLDRFAGKRHRLVDAGAGSDVARRVSASGAVWPRGNHVI